MQQLCKDAIMTSPRKKSIFFDLTRMVGYLDRLIPSGIERVDVNYLHGLLGDDEFSVQGIVEFSQDKKSYLILINKKLTKKICENLYKKWILGESDDQKFDESQKYLKQELVNLINSTKFANGTRIDKSLLEFSKDGNRPIYVNCTFINIPDGLQHYELISHCKFSPVYVVHDLIPVEFPEYGYTNDKGQGHLARLMAICNLNATIVAISEHVKNKILDACRALGVVNFEVFVNNNGVDHRFINKFKENLMDRKNQFVFVSTIEPRKNHLLLLNVWRKIINSGVEWGDIPKLHIIGRRGWGFQAVTNILDSNSAMAQFVIEHNNASDEEMVKIINESKAMLFPSFDEGWGLPIVEALALGTPVICSDILAHRECTQGKAIYIDAIDGLGWYDTIMKVSRNEVNLDCGNFKPVLWSEASQKFNRIINSVQTK